jgi:hypothetical protein
VSIIDVYQSEHIRERNKENGRDDRSADHTMRAEMKRGNLEEDVN